MTHLHDTDSAETGFCSGCGRTDIPVTCANCGDTTDDGHLLNGVCLRVNADELPAFERSERGDWQ